MPGIIGGGGSTGAAGACRAGVTATGIGVAVKDTVVSGVRVLAQLALITVVHHQLVLQSVIFSFVLRFHHRRRLLLFGHLHLQSPRDLRRVGPLAAGVSVSAPVSTGLTAAAAVAVAAAPVAVVKEANVKGRLLRCIGRGRVVNVSCLCIARILVHVGRR